MDWSGRFLNGNRLPDFQAGAPLTSQQKRVAVVILRCKMLHE